MKKSRKINQHSKKTQKKKSNNVKKNRKYKILIGGVGKELLQNNEYTYEYTLGTTGSKGTSNSKFNKPSSIAVSTADNRIYVTDTFNHRVQVYDATRNYIATLGTTGSRGDSNTQFDHPQDVAISDADNRIYVADTGNCRIQVFDGATLNYIATIGITGSAGVSNLLFNFPTGVAVSAADNRIYVADRANHRIQVFDGATRKYIATMGKTSSPGLRNTQFDKPMDVAISGADNRIYVVDEYNHRVQVFDGTTLTYIATMGTGRKGAANRVFNHPSRVAFSTADNRIYIVDSGNQRVQVYDGITLNYIATLGTTGSAGASNTQFNNPSDVAVSTEDNSIYVTDYDNHRIQVFVKTELLLQNNDYNYEYTLGTTGSAGASNTQFNYPTGVAVSVVDNRIYVTDTFNHRVQVFDGNTREYIGTLGTMGSKGTSNTKFNHPSGVAVSAADNRIYVSDFNNHRVQVFDGATLNYIATLGTTGSPGGGKREFKNPSGVAVSTADNRVYVADRNNQRVQVYDGATLEYIDTIGAGFTEFDMPYSVAISAADNRIYVVDQDDQRIQVYDGATREYIATIGITGSAGASNTQFSRPYGVAVSFADNRIYVTDNDNHRVQVFDGATLDYIGTMGATGSEGVGNMQFRKPTGVAISAVDNSIYIVDTGNHRVQVFTQNESPPSYKILNKGFKHIKSIYRHNTNLPSPKYVESLKENTVALAGPRGNPNL